VENGLTNKKYPAKLENFLEKVLAGEIQTEASDRMSGNCLTIIVHEEFTGEKAKNQVTSL